MDGHGVWVDIRASMHMARDELNGLRSEQGPEDVGDDMDELADLLDQAIRLAYQISPPAGRM